MCCTVSYVQPDASMQIKTKISARQLGFYLFWNLRSHSSGIALSESDVKNAAGRAGLRHKDSAWAMLDQNGDSFASLDEVRSRSRSCSFPPLRSES